MYSKYWDIDDCDSGGCPLLRDISAGAVVQRQRSGLLITGLLVRTHSGASFVINFTSLSSASAWPSLA